MSCFSEAFEEILGPNPDIQFGPNPELLQGSDGAVGPDDSLAQGPNPDLLLRAGKMGATESPVKLSFVTEI